MVVERVEATEEWFESIGLGDGPILLPSPSEGSQQENKKKGPKA